MTKTALVLTDVVLSSILESPPVAIKAAVFKLALGDEFSGHESANTMELVAGAELAHRNPVRACESSNGVQEHDSCGRLAPNLLQSHVAVLPPNLES